MVLRAQSRLRTRQPAMRGRMAGMRARCWARQRRCRFRRLLHQACRPPPTGQRRPTRWHPRTLGRRPSPQHGSSSSSSSSRRPLQRQPMQSTWQQLLHQRGTACTLSTPSQTTPHSLGCRPWAAAATRMRTLGARCVACAPSPAGLVPSQKAGTAAAAAAAATAAQPAAHCSKGTLWSWRQISRSFCRYSAARAVKLCW